MIGKSFEKNIIDLIQMTCDDAKEQKSEQIQYTFYYNGKTTQEEVDAFMKNFKRYDKYVKVFKVTEMVGKSTWYSIMTTDEYKKYDCGRAFHILKEVSEQTLTQAILDFYSKAKLQIKLSKNGKK